MTQVRKPRAANEGAEGGRADARTRLIRSGLELLTERGFGATGIDEVLRRADAPKGSFYHHFHSKSEFALILISEYNNYFRRKIAKSLSRSDVSGYKRIESMIEDLGSSMIRHGYRRGCLIGNFTQEMGGQDEAIRRRLEGVFLEWEMLLAECLAEGQRDGSINTHVDCKESASFFWIGWEGAIMRAKITVDHSPLTRFASSYLAGIRVPGPQSPRAGSAGSPDDIRFEKSRLR